MGSGKVGSHVVGAELLAACPPPPSYLLEGPDLGFPRGSYVRRGPCHPLEDES
jgi:hypothetical protein